MQLVIAESVIHQDKDGRYSLNDLHRASGGEARHQPAFFLRVTQTKELIDAIQSASTQSATKTVNGGPRRGTYACKELVYAYAMWIDAKFCLKVIRTFDAAVNGKADHARLRHEAASTFKVMTSILAMTRADEGKETVGYHYSNEARLINSLLSGEFKGLNRDALSSSELALLAHLEERNAVLIGRGLAYDQRKSMLRQYAMDWRIARTPALEA